MIQKSPQEYKEAYEYHKAQGNADKAKRVADLYRQQLRREQSRERDSAFDFSIDQAQKMYGGFAENIGRLTGSENLQAYGQQVQAQQDKDIARGGYQSKYSTFNDSFDKEGIVGGLKWAIEGVQENFASAGTSLVGAGAVALAAKVGMPAWAVASLGGLTGLNNIALNTGENVLEQKEKVGDFNELKATGAGLIAGFLDTLGASRAIPKSKLNTMTVDEIEKELIKKGHSNAASEFVKRMGAEGLTELSQEAIIMGTTATEGGRYTPAEVRDRLVDSFLLGGATSGAINAPIMTAQSAASLIKPTTKKTDTTEDQQAQASFAKRIATIAAENDYDLKDIKTMSDKGAYRAVDDAHVDLAERLKAKFKVLKEFVAPNKLDTLETLETKIQANAAQRKARNKTKNRVGKADFKAVSDLVGDTFEGQEVLNLMRELNVLTEVHNGGYVGGVSQITDAFNPLPMSSYGYDRGAAATERLIRPMAGLITGVGIGGAVPMTGAGLAAAGRAIDAVTGRRSAVNRFVEQNQANQPLPGPTVPRRESVQERRRQEELDRVAAQEQADLEAQQRAEQQAQAEDDKREANLRRVQEGAPPKLGSPEDIIRDGTGLNRAQIAQVLRILKANPNTLPDTLAAIQKYETSIATGGTVDYDLIRDINLFVDKNGAGLGIIAGPRNANAAQQGAQQNLTQKEQNYQRGIEANRNAASALSNALNEDRSVSALDKAAIQNALNFVSSSTITQNPVTRMQTELRRLKQQGVSDEAVGKYFVPYVQRVQDQQGASIDIVDAIDDLQESRMPPGGTNNPARISPALPTGVNPLFDAGQTKTPIGLDLIKSDPNLVPRVIAKMSPYIPLTETPVNDEAFLEQTVDFMKNNLLAIYNSLSPEYRERAKQWYVGANKLSQQAADTYGQSLEAVAGVMSALSPGLDWYVNYDIGVRAIDIYTNHQDTVFGDAEYKAAMKFVRSIKAKTKKQKQNKAQHKKIVESIKGRTLSELDPPEQAYFVRFYDVANAPERGHRIVTPEGELGDFVRNKDGSKKASVFSDFAPIATAMSILANPSTDNISALMGRGHKRRNFYNNILDPMSNQGDITIDTHAVGAALFLPLSQRSIEVVNNFGTPDSTNAGSYGTYGVYAEAYRRAASEVGVLPREMQSITWEGIRGLFPAEWKAQKKNVDAIRAIWSDYKDGKINLEQARENVYETAGNIRTAQWESDRPNFTIDEKVQLRNDAGSIPGTSVSRGDRPRVRSESPGRVPRPSEDLVQSQAPALLQPEQLQFNFIAPTLREVKQALPEAKEVAKFVVGKKGTKYEEGLRYQDALELAQMLNISVGVYPSLVPFGGKETTIGAYSRKENKIYIKDLTDDPSFPDEYKNITQTQALIHEVSHALESMALPNEQEGSYIAKAAHELSSAFEMSTIQKNSLREKVRNEILNDTEIKREIELLQDIGFVRTPIGKNATLQEALEYQAYVKSDPEMAVDPVMLYLMFPKILRQEAPKTAKLIRGHFNRASSPINIYANPLATILAILMAGAGVALRGPGEDEEEGALNMQRGALSA